MSELNLFDAVGKNQYYKAKYMLEHGVSPNGTFGKYSSTPLMNIDSDNINMAKLLVGHNAIIDIESDNKLTALLICAACGYIKVFNYLLKNGANCNHKNVDGWTAAHFAARNNYINILRSLKKHKADLYERNDQKLSPYDIAGIYKHKKIQRIIIGMEK